MNVLGSISRFLPSFLSASRGGRSLVETPKRNDLISIVIPAFEESKRIGATLSRIVEFMPQNYPNYETIVVDDGSKDDGATKEAVKDFKLGHPGHDITLLEHWPNRGKGFAVREGALAAKGDFLVFKDADESNDISEFIKFMARFKAGADVVIGSRQLEGSQIPVRQPLHREMMGYAFNYFVHWIVGLDDMKDTQCGMKAFRMATARQLFERQKMERFSFDVELLYMARKAGLKIDQVPVIWSDSPKSTVQPLKDSINMFMDLIRIRWIHRND